MRKLCVSSLPRLYAIAAMAIVLTCPVRALAANSNIATCTDFTANNSTLTQDVNQGDTVAMLGTLRAASGNTCGDPVSPTLSSTPPIAPTLGFQIAVVPGSNPVQYGSCSTGGGFIGNSDNGTYADPSLFTETDGGNPLPNPDVIDDNGQVSRHLIT